MKNIKELREITGAGILDCKKALEANNNNIQEAIKWLRIKGIAKAAKKASRETVEGVIGILQKDNKIVMIELNSETDFVAKNDKFQNMKKEILTSIIESNYLNYEDIMNNLIIDDKKIEEYLKEQIAVIGENIVLSKIHVLSFDENDSTIGSYVHANQKIGVINLYKGHIDAKDAKEIAMHVAAMKPKFIEKSYVSKDVVDEEKTIIINNIKNDVKNQKKPEQIIEKMVQGRLNKQLSEICLYDQSYIINSKINVGDFLKSLNSSLIKMIRFEVGEGIEKKASNFAEEVAEMTK